MLYILQNLTFAFETPKQQQCKQNLTWLDSIHHNYADVENKMKDSYLYFNVFWFLWMWFYLIFELVFGSLYKQYCQIDNCQHRTKGISKQIKRYYDKPAELNSTNWQILSSKYVFSNKELQNNTVKTAGLGDRIQAKHTQKKTILIWICTKSYFLIFLYNNSIAFKTTNVL